MTLHKSLKTSSRLMKHRNVLKKRERIQRLIDEERWEEEGASAFNLPKVRNIKIKKGKGKPKEEKEAAAAVLEEGAVEAAAEGEEQPEAPS
jgi:small basic protein (TIGR04137 family)